MIKKYLLIFIFIVFTGVLLSAVYIPKDASSKDEVVFIIEKGEGSKEIADRLEKEGLVSWGSLFRGYVLAASLARNLQAGTYSLSPSMSMPKIAKIISKGDTLLIKVTIPEGFTLSQIEYEINAKFMKYNLNADIKSEKLSNHVKDPFFLKGAPKTASLEGYLFPDTYFFAYGTDKNAIISAMMKNFDKKISSDIREDIEKSDRSFFEIITMASLLEREVYTLEDKKIVSGILWKRLESNMPLQVDATIAYITGKKTTKISIDETKIDSPYNTYRYRGLPLGPISNPGLDSIIAAVYPKNSDYWFYLSSNDGKTIFSRNFEEHKQAKARYIQ